jgi:hypothetical protein
MEEDILLKQRQLTCAHGKERLYKQRQFDILNGFELNFVRCLNCHKIIELEAKKLVK